MPEYLTPGVFIEEFDSGARSIEGVSTSTAAFLGEAERGPLKPRLITSFPEFTRVFGRWLKNSYLAYSIDGFFKNGGKRCFVSRIVSEYEWTNKNKYGAIIQVLDGSYIDIRAIGPGTWVNRLQLRIKTGSNYADANNLFKIIVDYWETDNRREKNPNNPDFQEVFDDLSTKEDQENYYENAINGVSNFIRAYPITFEAGNELTTAAEKYPESTPPAKRATKKRKVPFEKLTKDPNNYGTIDLKKGNEKVVTIKTRSPLAENEEVWIAVKDASIKGPKNAELFNLEIIQLRNQASTLSIYKPTAVTKFQNLKSSNKTTDPDHYVNKVSSIVVMTSISDKRPDNTSSEIDVIDEVYDENGFEVGFSKIETTNADEIKTQAIQSHDYVGDKWEIKDNHDQIVETVYGGLLGLEKISDISIVCAPDGDSATSNLIISHCQNLKDRFAIYQDAVDASLPSKITELRTFGDYKYAAIYTPWITVLDSLTNKPKHVPPSGFIAGVYARSDQERGVHKAPANEILQGVIGVPTPIDKGTQDALNPIGVNCIRIFPGRGTLVWGARTNSANPNWKYINVRRLFIFISKSIERATQWVVFEPNNERLWADVKATITQFLKGVWRTGALMGTTPEEGFFVRCDRSTMTEDDIQNGRLVCVIGLATTKPAEFVIFRLTQTKAGATFEEL